MSETALQKEFAAMPNLYEFMGVKQEADQAILRKAFKNLTFQYHPDLNSAPYSASKFIVLKRAHEILSDPKLRAEYDGYLQGKAEIQASKAAVSEKRKHFADLLKKREEEFRSRQTSKDQTNEDLVGEFLRKKRMTKNVERIYDDVGQKEINEVLEDQRKNKEELKKMLATVKVKWYNTGKSYTKVLIRMIFGRFGEINELQFLKEKQKCFIQYAHVSQAESAMKYFADKSDFSIKYLLIENRSKCLEKVTDKSTGFELSSDVLQRIAGVYNGFSFDNRRSQLDREIERQRQMKKLIDEQVNRNQQQ